MEKKKILQDTIFFEEEYYEIGTKIFPNTKNELSILWKNQDKHSNPKYILVSHPKSEWKFKNGIGIATSLKQLEKINKVPFCFLGFEWGFSGAIINWNKGKLENYFAKYQRVYLRLEPESYTEVLPDEFIGDTEINSSHKLIQQFNPKIYAIRIGF
ncbi:hypothetical protein [Aquimarina sp. I32.4]|uniref:hypothetical protein n=1 Tax=Aquimarina sp. I32.4 TaxID=2053903 RepID=UPI0011AFB24A|nr:hypothetical protein [Aquimarina sp. I32.4]